MNKEKKRNIIIALVAVFAVVIVIGGSFLASEYNASKNPMENNNNNTNNGNTDDEIPVSEQKTHTLININEYLDVKRGSDTSIIYVARPTCGYCQKQDPILKNVAYLYDLKVNYLNTDTLTEEEHTLLLKSDSYFDKGYGTPLILIVKDDKVVNAAQGLRSKDTLIEFFKENGLIKE